MRYLILLLIATAGVSSGSDLADLYGKFLGQVIKELERLVNRTTNLSPEDDVRIQCIYGLNAMVRNVKSSWALQMLDSYTKVQYGVLSGNLLDLGQYEECVQVKVEPEDIGHTNGPSFAGQHCVVSMNVHVPNGTISLNGEDKKLNDLFGVDYIPLKMAQCYPSICKPWVLEETLNKVFSLPDQALHLFGIDYELTVSVDQKDCNVKAKEPLDAVDWTVAAAIILLMAGTGVATILDYFHITPSSRNRQKTMTEEVVVAFSMYTNVKKLLDTNVGGDVMTSLNGLKFLSMAWVVLGHRYRFLISEPLVNYLDLLDLLTFGGKSSINYLDLLDVLKEVMKSFILSGPLAVDTFFLISGLLNIYTFCIIREKKKEYTATDVLFGYLHRFLRLTPAYLMMIGITATWLYRLNDGPIWDKIVGVEREKCRNYTWMNLVYLNNYLQPNHYCMMQSWYLAADMQMFWLSPLVIYPLWKWPKYGFFQLIMLVIASVLSPLLISYFFEIKAPIPITTDTSKVVREMATLYLPTHTKTVSYVLGIGAGYLFYKIKKGQISFKPSLMVRGLGWLVAGGIMTFSIFGGYYLYPLDTEYNRLYSAFFIGFQRFFWSLGLIWIIFNCILGYGGALNTFLSWKLFIPLGRLTYCVYLTHIAVILAAIGSMRDPHVYSDFDQLERYMGDFIMSQIAAFFLSMLLEAPMMKIEKIIFSGATKKIPRSKSVENPQITSSPPERHVHQA